MDSKMHNTASSPFKPRLIIHGGAGNIQPHNIPPKIYESYRTSLLSIASLRLPQLDTQTNLLTFSLSLPPRR
jgi:L-asparaginase